MKDVQALRIRHVIVFEILIICDKYESGYDVYTQLEKAYLYFRVVLYISSEFPSKWRVYVLK
jgi:hypothetical protein